VKNENPYDLDDAIENNKGEPPSFGYPNINYAENEPVKI
jgi:hypothetical protein